MRRPSALCPERPRVSLPTLEPARLRRRIILPSSCTQATCTKSLKTILTGIPINGIQSFDSGRLYIPVNQELLFVLFIVGTATGLFSTEIRWTQADSMTSFAQSSVRLP